MNVIKENATQKNIGIKLVVVMMTIILMLQVLPFIEVFSQNFARVSFQVLAYSYYVYSTLMFLTLSALIYIEVGNLEELQIDKFTLATLVLGTFIRPRLGVSGEGVFLVLTGLAGISVILTLLIKKPNIPATRIKWVMVGVATSSITIILITVLEIFFRGTWSVVAYNRIGIVFGLLARELTFTALVEEILFRGFLWGYLKRSGWDDNKTFWVQGLLFWLMHLGKIFSPFTFFIAIPLFTILFSKIRLHSRQLFPSIASHLLVNVISALLNMATY